jgi:ribonuclease HI
MSTRLTVYADGACSPNPGRGGWAWATSMTHFDSGFATQTTNQQMELTAALKARMAVQGPIEIVSDSTYVVNCFKQRWYEKWRTNGWRNSGGTPVTSSTNWQSRRGSVT